METIFIGDRGDHLCSVSEILHKNIAKRIVLHIMLYKIIISL